MPLPGIVKRYDYVGIQGSITLTENLTTGTLVGFEWTKGNGNSFRVVILDNDSQFNFVNKSVSFSFAKQMRESGDTVWVNRNTYRFDGSEYINNNFGNASFGKMMVSPFNIDGVTLKPNAKTFFDYFYENFFWGVLVPVPLKTTLLDIAATKENVTLP